MMGKIAVWVVTMSNVFFVAFVSPFIEMLFQSGSVRPDSLTAEVFIIIMGVITFTPEIAYFIVPKYRRFVHTGIKTLRGGVKLFGALIAIQFLVITSLFNIIIPEYQLWGIIGLALGSNFFDVNTIINKIKKRSIYGG